VSRIRVVDPKLDGIEVTCDPETLAPGEEALCATTEPYTVTGADMAAGAVTNVATATGTDPDGDPVESPEDTTSVATTQPRPALELVKTAGEPVDVDGDGEVDAGDTIAYTFTVTNVGNVRLDDVT